MTDSKAKYLRFYPWLKWIVTAASIIIFAVQISKMDKSSWQQMWMQVNEHWVLSAIIICLAIFNWSCEALKFKTLIASAKEIPFVRSFLIVLGGMAVSNFTPARTGEYLGRGLLMKEVHPIKVVIATVTGNLAQVILTYSLGLLATGAYIISGESALNQHFDSTVYPIVIGSLILAVITFFIVYGKKMVRFIQSKLPTKIQKTLNIVEHYNKHLFLKVLRYASLRYLAFSLQFFLLLYLFSGQSMPWTYLFLVPAAYLLQSLMPVPAVGDVGVRIVVSTLLFGSVLSEIQISQAVTSLWFINLILPGILGTIYLLTSIRMKE